MITIKTKDEIDKMRIAGHILYDTKEYLKDFIKPGITTKEIDEIADDYIENKRKAKSAFKGLYGFPGSICISVNNEVVHGIPGPYKLKEGDIITCDIGVNYEGYMTDSAMTYPVGEISDENKKLIEVTHDAMMAGIKMVKPGNRIGDISNAIETYAKKFGYGIVEELGGHGIGTEVHEDPFIPNFGKKGTGPILKEGMVIAIEPMLNMGTKNVFILDDDWTIVTADDKNAAHFEHTVAVTKDGYEILTGDYK